MKNFKSVLFNMSCLITSSLPAIMVEPTPPSFFIYTQAEEEVKLLIQRCRSELEEESAAHPLVIEMFDETVAEWQHEFIKTEGSFNLQLLLEALSFAKAKHKGQIRKDASATPYIIHPVGVARLLWELGEIRDEKVLIAALLHDTLEDTDATSDEIEKLFGSHVRLAVEELTNDPNLSMEENKKRQVEHAHYLSHDAKLVKLADRLYNVRDLRIAPPNWTKDHFLYYLGWGQKLLNALSGTNQRLEEALQDEIRLWDKSLPFISYH